MQMINENLSIYDIVKQYPEVKEIMYNIGFKGIMDPSKLNTVGRYMTLEKGAKLKKISIDSIRSTFKEHGFILKEDEK